jgi:hypothetical protein
MTITLEDTDETTEMVSRLVQKFKPKFVKASGSGFETGELACKLAEAAILAERERCKAIAAKVENTDYNDQFGAGWSAAGCQIYGEITMFSEVRELLHAIEDQTGPDGEIYGHR